jgi:hypothetical protein
MPCWVVFPLDALLADRVLAHSHAVVHPGIVVVHLSIVVACCGVVVRHRLTCGADSQELHAALGTAAWLVAGDFWVHGAGVRDRPSARRHCGRVVHLRDQRQRLVWWRGQPAVELLPLGRQLWGGPQLEERIR